MEKLQWQLEVLDRVSAPAGKAAQALARFQITLNHNGQTLEAHGAKARSASGGLESWITKANSAMNVATGLASAVAGVTSSLVNMGVALAGAVIHQAEFHQGTMTTLHTLLGSAGGDREFNASLRMASLLPGSTEEFVSQRRSLVGMGFTDTRERDRIFAMQQDLAALNPQDSTVGDRSAAIFGQVRGLGHLDTRHARELSGLNAGLSIQSLYQEIGRARGLSGSNVTAQVQRLVTGGQIHDNETFNAIARVISSRTHQNIGGFARQQGNSISGMVSNIQDLPNIMLQRFFRSQGGATGGTGMSAFNNVLRQINDSFADGAPRANRLLAIFDRLINGVFGQLSGMDVGAIIDRILDSLEQMTPVVIALVKAFRIFAGAGLDVLQKMLGPLFARLGQAGNDEHFMNMLAATGRAFGYLAGAAAYVYEVIIVGLIEGVGELVTVLEAVFGAIIGAGSAIGSFFSDLWNTWTSFSWSELGQFMVDGIRDGLSSAGTALLDAMSNLGGSIINTFRDRLSIHSPSRVFFGFGENIAQGLALGMDRGASDVQGSLAGLVPVPRSSLSANGLAASASRSVSIGSGAVQLTMHLPPGTHDPEAIANAVRPVVMAAIADALERGAIEQGES